MKLLAISGGPDSMLMLSDYRKQKVVVAHVNYNKREDSHIDQKIVEDFCKENNIPLEILDLHQEHEGNFQSWARDVRYDFFKKVYDQYNCDQLLIAHHKDDFIETALMQQRSGRTPRYFGIRNKNTLNGMNINRPYLSYFKDDILKTVKKLGIPYAVDYSNAQPVYTRNEIRIELSSKTKKEKNSIYSWFKMSNKILKKKFKRVDKTYDKWKETKFELKFFRAIKRDQLEILYELINDNFNNVKLSKNKIKSLQDFIQSPEGGKSFVLNKNYNISKKKGYLLLF